jgi:DNA repair protein RecO (recombination protein O)
MSAVDPLESLKKGQDLAVPALVLRITPYRDSDIIAHILTPSLGKLSVLARHARGSRKRFPSSLDLFDRGSARLTRERNGAFGLKEFTPSHSLKRVRDDLDKLTLASLLCETFDLLLHEESGEDSQQVFEILDLSLNAIDEASDLKGCLRAVYVALSSLTRHAGIIDLADAPPGSKALATLLDAIERFTERRLATRSTLGPMLKKISAS